MSASVIDRIRKVVRSLVADGSLAASLGEGDVDASSPIEVLGIHDSVAKMILLQALEDEFDLRLPEGRVRNVKTLGELAELIEREVA
jgi:acyl carrier protein